ncbi:MAG: RnfABCDGE type electron transport complex subunit G [Lachnospiraceae bacterium]
MNKVVKDALLLTLITLVAGTALGLVYNVTKQPIADANAKATQEAYKAVFDSAETFEDVDIDTQEAEKVLADNGYADDDITSVVAAKDSSGTILGYVLNVTSHAGYGGDISFSMGVKEDGTLNGYSITDISETAGLGMKAKESAFMDQFKDHTFSAPDSYLEVSKVDASASDPIEAISGATITSKAMTYGVDAGMCYFRNVLAGGN